jgi:hypothetical protein
LDISGNHADFHEGHGTVGAWQGRGMACELTNGIAGERHGHGMLCMNRPFMSVWHCTKSRCSGGRLLPPARESDKDKSGSALTLTDVPS